MRASDSTSTKRVGMWRQGIDAATDRQPTRPKKKDGWGSTVKHRQWRWPILLLLGREWLIAWSVKKRFAIKAKVNEKLLALMKPTGRGEEEEDG